MKIIIALIVKFALTLGVAWIAFSILDNHVLSLVLLIAVISAFINYVIGDLFIFPTFGNAFASLANGGFAVVIVFLLITLSYDFTTLTPLIVFSVGIAVSEYFFHTYLLKIKDFAPNHAPGVLYSRNLNYSTETADELHVNNYNLNYTNNGQRSDDKNDY